MPDATSAMKTKTEEASSQLGHAADSVKSAASYVSDAAREAAAAAAKEGKHAASYLGQKAEGAASAMGSGLKAAGDAIRQNVPQEGTLGHASSAVARTLDETGNYLQQEGLKGLGSDVAQLIRKNPLPAVLIGVGVGYLVSHAMTSRR